MAQWLLIHFDLFSGASISYWWRYLSWMLDWALLLIIMRSEWFLNVRSLWSSRCCWHRLVQKELTTSQMINVLLWPSKLEYPGWEQLIAEATFLKYLSAWTDLTLINLLRTCTLLAFERTIWPDTLVITIYVFTDCHCLYSQHICCLGFILLNSWLILF